MIQMFNLAGEGQCEAKCDQGFHPCPHNKIDADGWCTDCDTPADERNPKIDCTECR